MQRKVGVLRRACINCTPIGALVVLLVLYSLELGGHIVLLITKRQRIPQAYAEKPQTYSKSIIILDITP